jgi:hypothetical protein
VVFRFVAGLLLALSVSLAGIWLEKQTLSLHRELSLQHYQADVLEDWKTQHLLAIRRIRTAHQQEQVLAPAPQPGKQRKLSSRQHGAGQ